jgi:hypothetical protein
MSRRSDRARVSEEPRRPRSAKTFEDTVSYEGSFNRVELRAHQRNQLISQSLSVTGESIKASLGNLVSAGISEAGLHRYEDIDTVHDH